MSTAQNNKQTDRRILTSLPSDLDVVDYIIVGGGTAGCIIAARLADAYPTASILVVEAGPESVNLPAVKYPALYRQHISPTSTTLKFHFAAPEPQLANRPLPMATGMTLGGGSAVNLLMYARGQQDDFADWKTEGWSFQDILPFLKKSETYFGLGNGTTHGDDGPISVSTGRFVGLDLQKDFIAAFNSLGYPTVPDIQDLDSSNAVSATYRTVSPTTGRRQDTAFTYLYPRLKKSESNRLFVLVETQVLRILFDNQKKATGVEIRTKFSGTYQKVGARKLVVLSAGAMGSPQLLQLSGVGDTKILNNAGVAAISHLPGVGREYQNHQLITINYKADLTILENVDSAFNGILNTTKLIEEGADILSWNGVDASAKIRPTDAEIASFSPGLRQRWDEYFAPNPSRPFGVIVLYAGVMDITNSYPSTDRYFTMACYNPYARSRGYVQITGPGIDDMLDFKTGILSDTEATDIEVLVWLYKKQRQVAKKMSRQRGQVSLGPVFPKNSSASEYLVDETYRAEPTYSSADDEAIKAWIRQSVGTPFHSLGTCKMAPESTNGVVDSSLNVYGVNGLKVADLSIAPGNVAGNTMNAAVLIAEKAADIIIRDF